MLLLELARLVVLVDIREGVLLLVSLLHPLLLFVAVILRLVAVVLIIVELLGRKREKGKRGGKEKKRPGREGEKRLIYHLQNCVFLVPAATGPVK